MKKEKEDLALEARIAKVRKTHYKDFELIRKNLEQNEKVFIKGR
jgi:hypothetical protein